MNPITQSIIAMAITILLLLVIPVTLFYVTQPTIERRCVDGKVQIMEKSKGDFYTKTNVECQSK